MKTGENVIGPVFGTVYIGLGIFLYFCATHLFPGYLIQVNILLLIHIFGAPITYLAWLDQQQHQPPVTRTIYHDYIPDCSGTITSRSEGSEVAEFEPRP